MSKTHTSHSKTKRTSATAVSSRRAAGDREPLGLDVVFQSDGGVPRIGHLHDLSAGGACIESSKPCATGEAVLVHLPWPSREEPTSLASVVRWTDAKRMGVQFSMTGAPQLDAIVKLGRDRATRAATARSPREGASTAGFTRDDILAVAEEVHSMKRRVRFQEVDAAGTIYYSRVFEYFGDVYVELLERFGLSVSKVMQQRAWFAPLVHAEADYLAPMRFGDTVTVGVAKVSCGTSAATVGYRISARDGRALALGHTVHVFVDGTTFRPCPIPAEVRHALTGE